MMKSFNLKRRPYALLGAGLISVALAGCSDGDDGENGKDGVIGIDINATSTLKATFTHASIDAGKVTVDFRLENANGVAILGLTNQYDLRFGIAQLTPVTATQPDGNVTQRGYQWQAYINSLKQPNPEWIPADDPHLNPGATFQAGVEAAANCQDCLTDNQDGSYRYTFQTNIANITVPLPITYQAELTQRATLELVAPQAVTNAHFDWQPSTGKTEDIQSRDVVSIASCYACHQPESLALHGGRRIELESCASCHTATSADPESGNSVDFTYMIHAIHKGQDRVGYDKNAAAMVPAPYKVIGYKGSQHDYGKVMYPQQPAADCAACHVEGEGAPADAGLFHADLSNSACIGCHTETPSKNHSDTDCVACHNSESPYHGTDSAAKRHGDVLKGYQASQGYSAHFSHITAQNGTLSFDVQILDDKGQAVGKEFIANPSMYTKSSIYFSWDIDQDYPAYDAGSKYGDRGFSLLDETVSTYQPESKTFSINSAASNLILPDLNGKSVELYAAVATCFNKGGYGVKEIVPTACDSAKGVRMVYIQHQPLRFTWNGSNTSEPAKQRRTIIDDGKCMECHNQEIVHYDNGVNCQACHTPDKGLSYGAVKSPTSFAYKAHHASGHYLKYAGVGSSTVVKTDCSTCHTEQGIELGRAPERAWRYADTHGADIWMSSDTGACMSCHQKYLSDAGKAHIEGFGGIIDGQDKADVLTRQAESCATCHSPEQVRQLHGH